MVFAVRGEEACGIARRACPTIDPAAEPFGVAPGEFIEQGGACLDQAEALSN